MMNSPRRLLLGIAVMPNLLVDGYELMDHPVLTVLLNLAATGYDLMERLLDELPNGCTCSFGTDKKSEGHGPDSGTRVH